MRDEYNAIVLDHGIGAFRVIEDSYMDSVVSALLGEISMQTLTERWKLYRYAREQEATACASLQDRLV